MSRPKRHDIDIKLADLGDDSQVLGLEVCRVLGHKGFCTIATEIPAEEISVAINEVKEVQRQDRFERPKQELQEALLGPGSAEIAEFFPPWVPEKEQNGATLTMIDDFMAEMTFAALRFAPETIGLTAPDRTLAWLHRADDDPPGFEEEFTGDKCSRWLNHFCRARLLVLFILGPKGGTLELQPFDDDSEAFEVNVVPGTVVILRSDLLSHRYNSRNGEYVLGAWFCTSNISGARSVFNTGLEAMPRIPIVQFLLDWAWDTILEIKDKEEDGLIELDPRIPREWQLAASRRLSRKRTHVAVRGIGFKMPNTVDLEGLHSSLITSCDFATDVPKLRWEHTGYYDPDPECYTKHRHKTPTKHCSFIDGADLFDNKFFTISNLEAKVMEPMQKNTLETTYQALHQAGYTSKGDKTRQKLMQKFIGVYAGAAHGEFAYVDHEQAGGCAGSEGSPAIIANRLSFVLGMMGPSYTIQADSASGLLAIHEGAYDVLPNSHVHKPMVDASACTGTYLNLAPYWWPLYGPFMSAVGRCFSFDQDASGWIRGEGASSVVLKRHGEMVDGEFVTDNEVNVIATLVGWTVTQNGRSASLSAPNGVAQQMGILDCVRQANVSPLDIDCVACHAEGRVLHEAVEVNSLSKVLRDASHGSQIWGQEILPLTSVMCRMGNANEAQGMHSFLMMLAYQRYGCLSANIHLKVINPHIVESDAAVNIGCEPSALRMRQSFAGVSAHGFQGTNAHVQMKCEVNEETHPAPKLYLQQKMFSFWPGGGGQIEYSAEPLRGYTILGSWSCWQDLEAMQDEGQGVYSFSMTLGENRFEQFVILLDGDRSRTLHPGQPMAPIGSTVVGPDIYSEVDACNWLLDGRPTVTYPSSYQDSYSTDSIALREVDTAFSGVPGDLYRIQLRVAGKWRTVIWEKVKDDSGTAIRKTPPRGKYCVSGSWSGWSLEEMEVEDAGKGLYVLEVCLLTKGDRHFQVVRNMDPGQVFYPAYEEARRVKSSMYASADDAEVGGSHANVEGPDDQHDGRCWELNGEVGDVFRIEFRRSFELGVDLKEISFRRTGKRTPEEERTRKQQDLENRASERRLQEDREAAELEAQLQSA